MKSIFSSNWLRSIQPRKQRKFRFNAPHHVRGEFLNARLSKELAKKYNVRSLRVRKGDKVTVVRGQFKKNEGIVERVDVSRERVFVAGADLVKKDGSKVSYPVHPSNIVITAVVDDDKLRFKQTQKKESAN